MEALVYLRAIAPIKKEEGGGRKEEVRPGFLDGTPRRNLPARTPMPPQSAAELVLPHITETLS